MQSKALMRSVATSSRVAEVEHLAHLAAAEFGYAGQVELGQGRHGRSLPEGGCTAAQPFDQ
jgi:hypothetical protein